MLNCKKLDHGLQLLNTFEYNTYYLLSVLSNLRNSIQHSYLQKIVSCLKEENYSVKPVLL